MKNFGWRNKLLAEKPSIVHNSSSIMKFLGAVVSFALALAPAATTAQQLYTAEANSDQITDALPGQKNTPSFNHFSGYLPVDNKEDGKKIFYWYFESESNPSTDPVVLWTNGGPGCSGLLGLFTENGPFVPDADGNINDNEFSWNKIANVLFVEQPAGVGFSYSGDKSDYKTGDDQAAVDNYELIKSFLERFPERKKNDFYISSESYGGHYMPQLAKQIVDNNDDKSINFKGFAVGNPYTNAFTNNRAQFRAYYFHGLVPAPVAMKWEAECTDSQEQHLRNLENCTKYENIMMKKMGDGINPYALDYPVCPDGSPDAKVGAQQKRMLDFSRSWKGEEGKLGLPAYDDYNPCVENYLLDYLNRDDVKSMIHAKDDVEWGSCSDIVDYEEKDMERDTAPLYNYLIDGGFGLNILVYSGDDDSVCALTGTNSWIWTLGYDVQVGEYWNDWQTDLGDGNGKQTSGYYTKFAPETKLTFATVHGAGHEVPTYRPKQALQLLENFLSGDW